MKTNQFLSKLHADKAGILGFTIGAPRDSLLLAKAGLRDLGFISNAPADDVESFKRLGPQGKMELLTLSFDEDATLVTLMLILEGDGFTDASSAKDSAERLVDMATASMGSPAFCLDDIDSWANEGGMEDNGACAYSGCWPATPTQASGAASGYGAQPTSPSEYLSMMRAAPGPLTSVTVTAGEDERGRCVVLMLTIRE